MTRSLRLVLGLTAAAGIFFASRNLVGLVSMDVALTNVRPWATVLAGAALALGAIAALIGRTWGLLLVLAMSSAFVGAVVARIAPLQFLVPGMLGAVALCLTFRGLWRRDRAAALAALGLALGVGSASAASIGPGLAPIARELGALEQRLDASDGRPLEPAVTTGHLGRLWMEGYRASASRPEATPASGTSERRH